MPSQALREHEGRRFTLHRDGKVIHVHLFDHEIALLQMLADGHAQKTISRKLPYSPRTIVYLYQRLGALNAPHCVAIAMRANIIQ